MTYKEALKKLRKVGAAHATGEVLAAMEAELVAAMQGGRAETYYAWILTQPDYHAAAKRLLTDRAAAWDVLMGIELAVTV